VIRQKLIKREKTKTDENKSFQSAPSSKNSFSSWSTVSLADVSSFTFQQRFIPFTVHLCLPIHIVFTFNLKKKLKTFHGFRHPMQVYCLIEHLHQLVLHRNRLTKKKVMKNINHHHHHQKRPSHLIIQILVVKIHQ